MLLRTSLRPCCARQSIPTEQVRHATLIRRPKRPYTFTQLITLTDGSTFTHRTTSPQPVYRTVKDTKNTPLWNPSSQKLLNIEEDEAGRLRRFRQRFGRGFDVDAPTGDEEVEAAEGSSTSQAREESLLDLISGYGQKEQQEGKAAGVREEKKKSGKGKGGEK